MKADAMQLQLVQHTGQRATATPADDAANLFVQFLRIRDGALWLHA